jgi:tetratricopeptide (TPR) repeat protein
MDRDRLKDVHQTTLTEGRLNEDLVDWLKTKGPTWLLFVLVAVVAYLAVVRYRQHQLNYRDEAWQKLIEIQVESNPQGFEDVAQEYGDVDGIGMLARLEGAERLLRAIQTRTPISEDATTSMPGTMTAEQRTAAIERAVKFYDEMLALDNGSIGHTMFGVTACNGRAALAEAQGDIDAARQWYEKAATRAGDIYPQLAEQARHRIASLDTDLADVTFPATNVSEPTVALPPVQTDPNLLQIINEGSDAEKTG